MKRTPLKRGGSIRRKRKTPRWNQEPIVRIDYLEANPECQLKGIFTPPGGKHSPGVDPHHLLRIRVDLWGVILTVCSVCHSWGHEHDREFNVLTLLAKFRSGELDMDLLSGLKGKRCEWYLRPDESFSPAVQSAINELKEGGIFW